MLRAGLVNQLQDYGHMFVVVPCVFAYIPLSITQLTPLFCLLNITLTYTAYHFIVIRLSYCLTRAHDGYAAHDASAFAAQCILPASDASVMVCSVIRHGPFGECPQYFATVLC